MSGDKRSSNYHLRTRKRSNLNRSVDKTFQSKKLKGEKSLSSTSEILYNSGEDSSDILYNLPDFLSQEVLLVKTDREESEIITRNPTNIDNDFYNCEKFTKLDVSFVTECPNDQNGEMFSQKINATSINKNLIVEKEEKSPQKVSQNMITDTELMFYCDKVEEEPKEEVKNVNNTIKPDFHFSSLVVQQIYEDFSELEDKLDDELTCNNISNIILKRKITKTYSKTKSENKNNKSTTNILCNEKLMNILTVASSSNIDVVLSQPVSENLLSLTSYFLPRSFSEIDRNSVDHKSLKMLEDTKISIDIQNIIEKADALFFGSLFNYEYKNVKIQNSMEDSNFKDTSLFRFTMNDSLNKSESCSPLLRPGELSGFSTPIYKKSNHTASSNIYMDKQETPKSTKNCDLFELWPDDNLLQKIETNVMTGKNCLLQRFSTPVGKRIDHNKLSLKFISTTKKKFLLPKNENIISKTINFQSSPSPKPSNIDVKKINYNIQVDNPIVTNPIEGFPVFLTASNKSITVSENAFSMARNLIKSKEDMELLEKSSRVFDKNQE